MITVRGLPLLTAFAFLRSSWAAGGPGIARFAIHAVAPIPMGSRIPPWSCLCVSVPCPSYSKLRVLYAVRQGSCTSFWKDGREGGAPLEHLRMSETAAKSLFQAQMILARSPLTVTSRNLIR